MLNFFENINLKATRLLEGYYSLFCGLFTLCVGVYGLALVFRVEWLLLAASACIYACFVLLAFRSLFWFVLSLIFSPVFAIVVRERYDENLFLDFNRSINLEKKNVIIDYIKNNKDILDETLSISQRYLDKAENSIAEINEEVNKELIFIMNRLARREY